MNDICEVMDGMEKIKEDKLFVVSRNTEGMCHQN